MKLGLQEESPEASGPTKRPRKRIQVVESDAEESTFLSFRAGNCLPSWEVSGGESPEGVAATPGVAGVSRDSLAGVVPLPPGSILWAINFWTTLFLR